MTISHFRRRNWIGLLAALGCLRTGSPVLAQANSSGADSASGNASATPLNNPALALTLGPLNLHPRVGAGMVADDNILFTAANEQSDIYWWAQPGFQAVMGDDASLLAIRDQHGEPLNLSPGSLIVQPPEVWMGKTIMLDYAPRFKYYDQHHTYNTIDEFATLNLLWPMDKLILGFRQDYQLQEQTIIEANQLATSENINTALSGAYQLGGKTSFESNFRRASVSYDLPNLIGYTEYSTEDWINYELTESMPVSLGVLAGYDAVDASGQDQSYEQLRARVRYNLTQKLVFDLSAGGEERQFQSGRSDALNPVFSITGTYTPTERTRVSLTGYRQQSASILNGYNYVMTGATVALSQDITDRFTAAVSGGYYVVDYQAVNGAARDYSNDYYTARLSLDAKILRHLVGQFYYNLTYSETASSSGINPGNIMDNQVGVNLTWSY